MPRTAPALPSWLLSFCPAGIGFWSEAGKTVTTSRLPMASMPPVPPVPPACMAKFEESIGSKANESGLGLGWPLFKASATSNVDTQQIKSKTERTGKAWQFLLLVLFLLGLKLLSSAEEAVHIGGPLLVLAQLGTLHLNTQGRQFKAPTVHDMNGESHTCIAA